MSDPVTAVEQPDSTLYTHIDQLLRETAAYHNAAPQSTETALCIRTLGGFRVWRHNQELESTAWTREKAVHLLQFFITLRRQYLHKEQIIDRLWPELDPDKGDRDFKVALNAINKALEPDRPPRTEPTFVQRHGLAYGLNLENIWLDTEIFESLIAAANGLMADGHADVDAVRQTEYGQRATECLRAAVRLYTGDYLPERRYEDWTSAERERLQVLALGAMTTLAELLLDDVPLESIRLAQRVLTIDPVWEDAYRVQMRAYTEQGNRPLALRTYQQCVTMLQQEFDVDPLPETTELYEAIRNGSVSPGV